MPGSKSSRVWTPAPEPAAAPPLRPPLPPAPARATASSGDALVKGRGGGGGGDGCCAQSMAMADLLVQDQPTDGHVPDAEGESSEMDTLFTGGAMPSVSQTGSGQAALPGKDSIHKATTTLQGLGFPGYPAAVPAGYIIPQVLYNDAVNYGPNGYAGDGGGRYQNNKPAATMAAAPPPTLPDDLIEEILLRLPLDDPASLLCASLVCKTWSHIAKVQLKRALLQGQLKRALLQGQLKRAQLLQLIENAQLKLLKMAQLQEEHNQLQEEQNQLLQLLKNAQLQEEHNQLLQRRLASSSSRAPSSRRRSASSSSSAPSLALLVIVHRSLSLLLERLMDGSSSPTWSLPI